MIEKDSPPLSFRTLLADSKTLPASFALLDHPAIREANAKYRPWRKLRPIAREAGLDPKLAWAAAKFGRLSAWRPLPLKNGEGAPFGLCAFPAMNEQLHRIDQACGGGSVAVFDDQSGLLTDPEIRKRFMIRTMMEEAIESSRLEGAVTTRELALDLLRSGRLPKTSDEIMVANNYAAMQLVKTWLDRPLSSEMLCELQTVVARGTLDDAKLGRFRRAGEDVRVVDERTDEVVHTPPPAEGLRKRIDTLCAFANERHTGDRFIHPLVKACVLHFMVGYEHPFVDGNGRTARAAFYWLALRSGYRVFEFLTISELIRAAYAKYPQAYVDSETDDGDLTYFVVYKLGVIRRSIERLSEYLRAEEEKITKSLRLVRLDPELNLRQRMLVEHALRHPKTEYTANSHARSNNVSTMTARSDLEHLRKRRFFNSFKVRKEVHYVLSPDLPAKLTKQE